MQETTLTIPKEVKQNLESLSLYATDLIIASEDDASKAGIKISQISDLKKQVEAQRVEITKPLNASLRSINAFFKKFSNPLSKLDISIRGAVVEYGKKNKEDFFGVVHLRTSQAITIKDESIIPREYLTPDMKKIKLDIKAGKKIKGVKVSEVKSVSL